MLSRRLAACLGMVVWAQATAVAQPVDVPLSRPAPPAASETAWTVAGRQGLIQVVIVPIGQAQDLSAYKRQIERLCGAGQTCFVNFFTNSTGAPLEVPLPDAISREATALYRHSVKQGAELFRWSCRLGGVPPECF